MKANSPYLIKSIADFHKMMSLPAPEHPLISVINLKDVRSVRDPSITSLSFDFYSIWLEKDVRQKIRYGQNYFDFDKGVMIFIAPGQLLSTVEPHLITEGMGVTFHPSLIKGHPLAKKIKDYGFFTYALNEALHLSEKEEVTIMAIMRNIMREYRSKIDKYTQEVILSHIELMLSYANRFYGRQFITRRNINNDLLARMEQKLADYFDESRPPSGLPTVKLLADDLNISPSYLGDMLRELTGQNAQQHIQKKLLEKGKELLDTTTLSTGEIAFRLGFEHSQSFSRLFKQKMKISPTAYRSNCQL